MDDERFLKDWLWDTTDDATDPQASADRVLARVPEIRQRSRWWPWLPAHRARPRPTDDDHPPTVSGRTRLMFSPVKAITAGALVFALGGVLLIAQPFDQGGSVPGAEQGAEPAPAVKVTITVTRGTGEGTEEGCTSDTPEVCTGTFPTDQWSATDPRLSGTETTRYNEKWWPDGGDRRLYPVFEAYTTEVVNDKGRWVGTGRGTGPLDGLFYLTLTGEGEYEGLTAVVTNDPSDSDDDGIWTNVAVIVEGGLPPFPEPIE